MTLIEERNRPIGIFDSGLGGLSVAKEIFRQLPNEEIIYFGDTARFPYGTRSPERVTAMALQDAEFLMSKRVKMLLVACNTASSVAMDALIKSVSVPIIGVVEPGAKAAVEATSNGKVGIIGTRATVSSQSYQSAINSIDPAIKSHAAPCPLFVSLAEEGWTDGDVPRLVAEEYLREIRNAGVDTLILGCTHYPILRSVIAETMGESVTLVDSAESTVTAVREYLERENLLRDPLPDNHTFLVSDAPDRFREIGGMFLERKIVSLQKVILEDGV